MKFLRTLLLGILMPALVLPAGGSVCVHRLLGWSKAAECAACSGSCCSRRADARGPAATSSDARDCFVSVPLSDPVKLDPVDPTVVSRGADAPVALPPPMAMPRVVALACVMLPVPIGRRVTTTPLPSAALPLRR